MMPVLVPTPLAAIGVMVASHYISVAAKKRNPDRRAGTWASRIRSEASPVALAPKAPKITSPLDFAFHRVLDGFELNVAWRTNARRLAILGASGSGKSMTLRPDDEAGALVLGERSRGQEAPGFHCGIVVGRSDSGKRDPLVVFVIQIGRPVVCARPP